MQIYFSGNSFKYEIEAVAKLFFPVERFAHIFDEDMASVSDISVTVNTNEDVIFTQVNKQISTTILWVSVRIGDDNIRKSITIPNSKCKCDFDIDFDFDELDCNCDIDYNYNDECERNLCILLYEILNKITNITPKWGILTGVRPVSLIQKHIRLGKTKAEIFEYFQTKFLVSVEKLELAFTTAEIQLDIINSLDKNSYSLYVAIPFCVSKCSYCSFVSHAIKKSDKKVDEYISLLILELEKTAKIVKNLGLTLSSIYIGGGTPTALTASQLKTVVQAIAKYFPLEQASEYTIEAGRVDTLDEEKLIVIKNAWKEISDGEKTPVRISINPQTFNDEVLTLIGRNHTAQQVIDCYNLALKLGFEYINMDFIAGLPHDTLDSFKASINTAIELSPSNITVHTLSIKRSSDLFKVNLNNPQNANLDEIFKTQYMNDFAEDILIKNGYSPYYLYRQKNTLGNLENVGYAKKDFSIYNIYIMEEIQTIIACGAGAVTKIIAKNPNAEKPINRIFNFKYHFEYIDRFDEIIKRKDEVALFYDSDYA